MMTETKVKHVVLYALLLENPGRFIIVAEINLLGLLPIHLLKGLERNIRFGEKTLQAEIQPHQ